MTGQISARAQTRLSDFSEYRTKDDMQLTELGTIKARGREGERGERKKRRGVIKGER
jgi:hypothetical protein